MKKTWPIQLPKAVLVHTTKRSCNMAICVTNATNDASLCLVAVITVTYHFHSVVTYYPCAHAAGSRDSHFHNNDVYTPLQAIRSL